MNMVVGEEHRRLVEDMEEVEEAYILEEEVVEDMSIPWNILRTIHHHSRNHHRRHRQNQKGKSRRGMEMKRTE